MHPDSHVYFGGYYKDTHLKKNTASFYIRLDKRILRKGYKLWVQQ